MRRNLASAVGFCQNESLGLATLLSPLGLYHLLLSGGSSPPTQGGEAGGGLKRQGAVGVMMVCCLAVYVAVFMPLANLPSSGFFDGILERFWMQPYQIVCLLMAPGHHALLNLICSPLGLERQKQLVDSLLPLTGLASCLFFFHDRRQARHVDGDWSGQDWSHAV